MQIKNFYYSFPTTYYFGENAIQNLVDILPQMAKKVLIVSGSSSAQKLGILHCLENILSNLNIQYFNYRNCLPNPSRLLVNEIVEIIKTNNVDFIIAVGGGSVIDASKASIYELKDVINIGLGTIVTVPSSGSEANRSFVICDDNFENKIAKADACVIPKFAICDVEYTKTLSERQIACCLSDIMSHLLEQFFVLEDWNMIDDLIVASMKSLIRIADSLKKNFNNQLARQELILVSTFSLSYLLSCGRTMDWVAHTIEHGISGKYKTNHAEGMSIIMPRWIEYSISNSNYSDRLFKLSEELGIKNNCNTSYSGLKLIKNFYKNLNLCSSFIELIDKKPDLNKLADVITNNKKIGRVNCISKDQCVEFLELIF